MNRCPDNPAQTELTRAMQAYADAIRSIPLNAGERLALLAAASAWAKASANAGVAR